MSPFHLAFGTEAVQLTKVMPPTTRTKCVEERINGRLLQNGKAVIDYKRFKAIEHIQRYQEGIKSWYDKKVKNKIFNHGRLDLEESSLSTRSRKARHQLEKGHI